MFNIKKSFFVIFVAALAVGLSTASLVLAETQTGGITVGVTIPSSAVCGNGVVDAGEACDSGGSNGSCPATCSTSCTTNSCGSPGGGDSLPTISNVTTTLITVNSATVSWNASDDYGITTSSFVYGTDTSYGSSGTVAGAYSVDLSSLDSGTVYYFRISATDTAGQTVQSVGSFTTLSDEEPPPLPSFEISNVVVVPGITAATVNFDTNRAATAQIFYGLTASYTDRTALSTVAVTDHSLTVPGLLPNVTYHYRIVAEDASHISAETADATFTTLPDVVAPADVGSFTLTVVDDTFVLHWDNPDDADFIGVKLLKKSNTTARASGPDDDSAIVLLSDSSVQEYTDGDIPAGVDYSYTIYTFDTSNNHSNGVSRTGRISAGGVETICDNGLDDDGDHATDCSDSDCASLPICSHVFPSTACSDGIDNDGDGQIDSQDPGCNNPDDNDESDGNVPGFLSLTVGDLNFFVGNRQIILTPTGNRVSALSGFSITLAVPLSRLALSPESVILFIDGATYQLEFDPLDETYYSDFVLPITQTSAYLSVDYGNGVSDSLMIELNPLPWGVVESEGVSIEGVELTLLDSDGVVIDIIGYGQDNPINSDENGLYGWMVPDGQYQVMAKMEGYYQRVVSVHSLVNHSVNININLTKIPPRLEDVIDPDASILENVVNVSENLVEKTKVIGKLLGQAINKVANNPQVEKTAELTAPAIVGVSAVGTLAVIPWLNLVALLRFLFLQPLLLIGRGKRKRWGMVYNSLSKLPIDLAIVRLFDAKTNRMVRSRVTDRQGRYAFIVAPGIYRLEVVKMNLTFPSSLLAGIKIDGSRVDIYHGENIVVTNDNVLVTANIPLDPIGVSKTPNRILRERFLRKVQSVVSGLGLVFTLVALYIAPVWYMWVLAGVHVGLMWVFRRLAKPRSDRGWGIVSDATDKKPVGHAVARLFDSQFNRLVAMEVTDKKGRYNFLAGDNKYYVTYEHGAYEPTKTELIDLTGKTEDAIAIDATLEKKGEQDEKNKK